MYKVLIIDDNPGVGSALRVLFNVYDIESEVVLTPQAGLTRLLEDDSIGLVVQDMNFTRDTTSGEEGVVLFNEIRLLAPDMPVVIMTAWTQLESCVTLVQAGAADYIAKPWDDEKLIATVKNLLELRELQQQQLEYAQSLNEEKRQLEQRGDLCGFVYQSRSVQMILDMALRVAPAEIPILITGPNGSGKEKIAEIVQANSRVKEGPFIKVNVAALPADLIEAELFGAEVGAYTGATKLRIGRFEAADGGTLFLDELGNLSLSGQMKLLRVLQTGEFERLGSHETRRCKVRIISATNANLAQEIVAGRFREDLFYRLNVIEIKLPPLSERKEDVLPLLNFFLGKERYVASDVAKKLQGYTWPGNVRELENVVQRAKLLSEEKSIPFDAFGITLAEDGPERKRLVVEPDKSMIVSALKDNQGVIAHAARQLGLSRQALYRRMEKFDLHTQSDD